MTVAIDESAGTLFVDPDLSIEGGFRFRNMQGFSGDRGYVLGFTGVSYDELTAVPAAADAYLPHRLLQNVLETAQSASISQDGAFDVVAYRLASGENRSLLFDRRTHLLAAVRRSPVATVFGDQVRETIYGAYRRVGNATVPGSVNLRATNAIHGAADRILHLVQADLAGPTTAELRPPAGTTRRTPEPRAFETVQLGRDVFLLRNVGIEGPFSYNVLVVLFADHVMVVEAALNDAVSRRVIEAVGRLAPNLPIRTLVQTHHHGDHIGGIRTYIADGTTIIAPRGTRRLIDRIASTPSAIRPDALAQNPRAAVVEEVERRRVIRDQRNAVELHDVPSTHSAHMLVVYLPEQGVLYQGDLINRGETPLNATSRTFLAWLRSRRLPVRILAGLHGGSLEETEVRSLLATGSLP